MSAASAFVIRCKFGLTRPCTCADVSTIRCVTSALDNLALDSRKAASEMLTLGVVDLLVPFLPHAEAAIAEATASLLCSLSHNNSRVSHMIADNGGFRHLFARLERLSTTIGAVRQRVEASAAEAASHSAAGPGALVSPSKRMVGKEDEDIEPVPLEESCAACISNALYVGAGEVALCVCGAGR